MTTVRTLKGDPFEVAVGVLLLVDLFCETTPRAIDVSEPIRLVGAQPELSNGKRADFVVHCGSSAAVFKKVIVEVKRTILDLGTSDDWVASTLRTIALELINDRSLHAALVLPNGADGEPFRELSQAYRFGGDLDQLLRDSRMLGRANDIVLASFCAENIDAFVDRTSVKLLDAVSIGANDITDSLYKIQSVYPNCDFPERLMDELQRIAAQARYLRFSFTKESLLKELKRRNIDPRIRRSPRNRKSSYRAIIAAVILLAMGGTLFLSQNTKNSNRAERYLAEARAQSAPHYDRSLMLAAAAFRYDPSKLSDVMKIIQENRHFVAELAGRFDRGVVSDDNRYVARIEALQAHSTLRRLRIFDLRLLQELRSVTLTKSDGYLLCALSNRRLAVVSATGTAATIDLSTQSLIGGAT